MADLQQKLEKLLESYEDKDKLYNEYLVISKQHNEHILKLAESQPIAIKDFETAEELYDNMILSEKTYHIQKEVFYRNREDVVNKLTPVQNIKIKFTYTSSKTGKDAVQYYVWLKYSTENPDDSQLVLQKLGAEDNDPKLM